MRLIIKLWTDTGFLRKYRLRILKVENLILKKKVFFSQNPKDDYV